MCPINTVPMNETIPVPYTDFSQRLSFLLAQGATPPPTVRPNVPIGAWKAHSLDWFMYHSTRQKHYFAIY